MFFYIVNQQETLLVESSVQNMQKKISGSKSENIKTEFCQETCNQRALNSVMCGTNIRLEAKDYSVEKVYIQILVQF